LRSDFIQNLRAQDQKDTRQLTGRRDAEHTFARVYVFPGLAIACEILGAVNPGPNPEFMRRAIALASENVRSGNGGPFGAVIVRQGVIVGEGTNRVTEKNDPTAHAEVTAIRAACQQLDTYVLRGCEIYTSCEPCPMCLSAIYWAHLDRIWYGNTSADAARVEFDDAKLYREIALPPPQRATPSACLLHDEAWESFHLWLETPNKIRY
jgi:guanine deaminase